MGESQSRYSIVERLTQEKLKIIDEKANLDLEITEAEQKLEEERKKLEDWKSDVKEDVIRTERIKERAIELAEITLKNAKEQKELREGTCDNKLQILDEALEKLEEISKLSLSQEKQ